MASLRAIKSMIAVAQADSWAGEGQLRPYKAERRRQPLRLKIRPKRASI